MIEKTIQDFYEAAVVIWNLILCASGISSLPSRLKEVWSGILRDKNLMIIIS